MPKRCCTSSRPATRRAAGRLVDDLPLFSAAARRATPPAPPADALADALAAIHPDEMTPREALEAIYRLKALRKD